MCKTPFESQGMVLKVFKKDQFSKYVYGRRAPPPLHGKCHFKFFKKNEGFLFRKKTIDIIWHYDLWINVDIPISVINIISVAVKPSRRHSQRKVPTKAASRVWKIKLLWWIVLGTKKEDHCTYSTSLFWINDEIMISCVLHSTSYALYYCG